MRRQQRQIIHGECRISCNGNAVDENGHCKLSGSNRDELHIRVEKGKADIMSFELK